MEEVFHVRYFSADANTHHLPARHLAASLEGLDRIVVRFLWAIETEATASRSPSPATLSLDVLAPQTGCIDISLLVGAASSFMPFIGSMQEAVRNKLCEHIVSFAMLRWGGRRVEAEGHLGKALDIIEKQNERFAADRTHERETAAADRQREREHIAALMRAQVELHRADAAKAVKPIGESCRSMTITDGAGAVEVDEATAEAVKAREELEVSNVIEMTFQVDGIELSSKTLKVFDPDKPTRRINVHISDPAFDPVNQGENPYETAVRRRSRITLTGKATRKADGTLKTFHAISAQAL